MSETLQNQTPFEKTIYVKYPGTNCNQRIITTEINDSEIKITYASLPPGCYEDYIEDDFVITRQKMTSDHYGWTGADWADVKLVLPFSEQEFHAITNELIAELGHLNKVYESEDSLPTLNFPKTTSILKQKIQQYEELVNKNAEVVVKEYEKEFNKTLTQKQEQELKEAILADAGEEAGLGTPFPFNEEIEELLINLAYLADVADTLDFIKEKNLSAFEHYFD